MNFLNKLKGYTLEISVISGEKNVVITILKALEKAGYKDKIHYFDVDIHGGRNDAVIITTDGKLYYGPREDFNFRVNPKELDLIQLQRSMGLGGLRIINVEPEKKR
ncbi:MAG: hypothetical protein QW171_03100 [Candidatus Bilamarchaeaceae archaeon]